MTEVLSTVSKRPEYVVGIGASAGGLEALERFFDNVQGEGEMAFVVVQHLSPDFKSLMDELLARHTDLPIHLVEDGMLVEPNRVYLIPPKKEMIISGGRLLLSERDRQQELTLPIDVFFRSLAQDQGRRAVAIVLSGGGSDGSRGVRAVHEAGGLVLVQDVESAQFNGMPRTAREAGVANWILRPEEMPHVLREHVNNHNPRQPPSELSEPSRGLSAVYAMLQDEYGIDFTHYKPSTVTRRIERRLHLARDADLDRYVERLRVEHHELDILYRDLLIGVTRFFRNEEAFNVVEQTVLPELFERGSKTTPLRVWVAGCATGEEAYSLAILLHEASARYGGRPVKIFATDVHRGSLEIAARGLYEEEAVANVSTGRLERYFWRRNRTYQIVPDLRQMIVFAPHNVVRDAPFTRVDLVSCRNLLIYLQPPAQQKVLGLFHFALNRGGIAFLGPSESPGHLVNDFEAIDRHWRIYRKYSDVRFAIDGQQKPQRPPLTSAAITGGAVPLRTSVPSLIGTYDRLLDEFMPPSLLLTERGELVHAFGGASKFLRLRDGRPGLDIREVVGDDLKLVLVGGLSRALKSDPTIAFKGVRLDMGGETGSFNVTITRYRNKVGGNVHLLVSFERIGDITERASRGETEVDLDQVSRDQLGALETELSLTKENLQAAIEELETSNEELQAANEELLASNEELQATNEELQSVNEELYTVNAEYQRKITELTELTNDMDNLLASTDVGAVFLDRELRIRKFTPQIAENFKLLPQDIGRPLATFSSDLDHPGLADDLRRVLERGEPVERELRDARGRAFFLRILPYRAKGTIDGVVFTLIDISGLKAAEDALFHERYLLNSLLSSIPDAIYFKDLGGRFIRANVPMATRLGLSEPRDAEGKTTLEVSRVFDARAMQDQDEAVLRSGQAEHYRIEERPAKDGQSEWDVVTRLPLRDRSEEIVGIIGVFRDVTEQKRAEEKIQEAVKRRDQFLAMLSHELRNPLGAVVTATALLLDGEGQSESQKKLLRILERQSAQMSRLLDDLLEANRVTQNKIELRKHVIDLGQVARDAADAARNLVEARGHEFKIAIHSEPLLVDGDPARLQQIQVNLLSNAAKYTPEKGHVALEVGRENGHAIVRVKDDGVGIAKDMLETVFELFVQSNRTLDRAEGGIGVGLTLVRSLVAMHGGSVRAYSDGEGKGSEFVVRLPIASHDDAHDREPRPRRDHVIEGSRVVIVEDNLDSCQLLCELLGLAGFDCDSASDGNAGLELIERIHPDVAIIDVGLPSMDGFELARRLRSDVRFANTFLIALTGYGQPSDRARALQVGFDEHIVKPVHPEQLLRILGRSFEPPKSEGGGGGGSRPSSVLDHSSSNVAITTTEGSLEVDGYASRRDEIGEA